MKAEHMWSGIAASVIVYDLLCEEGTTLSECFRKQPIAFQVGEIALIGAHLLNLAPRIDPIHQAYRALK